MICVGYRTHCGYRQVSKLTFSTLAIRFVRVTAANGFDKLHSETNRYVVQQKIFVQNWPLTHKICASFAVGGKWRRHFDITNDIEDGELSYLKRVNCHLWLFNASLYLRRIFRIGATS